MIEIPLIAIISGALTIGVRLTGLMLFAPFFGSMVIPARIRPTFRLALKPVLDSCETLPYHKGKECTTAERSHGATQSTDTTVL